MSDIGYFSMYARFETESKEDAAAFLGADNIIGDAFSIEQEYVDGESLRRAHGHHRRKNR